MKQFKINFHKKGFILTIFGFPKNSFKYFLTSPTFGLTGEPKLTNKIWKSAFMTLPNAHNRPYYYKKYLTYCADKFFKLKVPVT